MSTQVTTETPKVPAIVTQFRSDLTRMESQFKMALPAHIPAERFMRVIMTAVQNNPKLLACDRQSFFNAAMKAAADGLLPDGREGAIVPFGEEEDDQGGRKRGDASKASWMPMVGGLRKIARNSGEIDTWDVHLVYAGDQFAYELGDEPFIKHRPAPTGGLHRKITHAYSIAKLKDGGVSRDVMNIEEIEDIRKAFSRAKKGPWSNPASYGEMCKKTVARRHSKVLPKSTDLDRVLHRDDDLYDFERARKEGEAATAARRPATVMAALDHFGGGGDGKPSPEGEPPGATHPKADDDKTEDDGSSSDRTRSGATAPGGAAETPTKETKPAGPPKTATEYFEFARKVIDGAKTAEEALSLQPWFTGEAQRKMRNACGIDKAGFDQVQGWINDKVAEFKT